MKKKKFTRQVETLLAKLTLDEKIRLCHAVTKFSSGGVKRLGIPPLTMSDGPHGVREEISADSWDAAGRLDDFATYLPTGTALAATWSVDCARKFGTVLGSEARQRRKDVILGPGVNMARTPVCGRNFEYYGEDPYLAGKIAASMIRAVQSQGTAACVKHYALNSQELRRHEVDARCDERTLREIYLPAFEMAVKEGEVMAVMGAYNLFRGQHCCHSDTLLNSILKREWGFDGITISDWAGIHDTLEAARGGMDIEMGTNKPYDQYYFADPLKNAVENGIIEPAIIDDKVRRILRIMFRLGILGGASRPEGKFSVPEHQTAAKEIALEAITLLKNRSNLLPLQPGKLKKLLIVGNNAVCRHHFGGQSSAVKALYEITPLEGIRNFLKDTNVEIEFFRGYPTCTGAAPIPTRLLSIADPGAGTRGWKCEIYDNHWCKGTPVVVLPFESADFDPERDLPEALKGKDYGVRMTTTLTPDKDEIWEFILDGISQAVLHCGGVNWVDNCKSEENCRGISHIKLLRGQSYNLEIQINLHVNIPVYPVRLGVRCGESLNNSEMDSALRQAAETADAILFFGGLDHTSDVEGGDRKDMELHGGQNELITGLAAINPRIAVVLVGGSPVEMPWAGKVCSIVQMWYAGMECGNAIAEILFGKVSPSGKLPFTFPEKLADSPAHALNDYAPLVCNYSEGLLMGYRWFDAKNSDVLFCFGHGLSYTQFEYSEMSVKEDNGEIIVSVEIRNTGKMTGSEAVQLYIAPPPGRFTRPPQELKGFCKCKVAPGKSKTAKFKLDFRSFAYYNPEIGDWEASPGKYEIRLGSSSRDIRITAEVKLN